MELTGTRIIAADVDTTWRALNDPAMLKACIPGAESVEAIGVDEYRVAMSSRIGPVNARFTGKLRLSDVVAPTSCRLEFEGQGGAAGFAKGHANVVLAADGTSTRMQYDAHAQIGGKLAQIGSRLVDGAARKIADDFFARFEAELGGSTGAPAAADLEQADVAAESASGRPAMSTVAAASAEPVSAASSASALASMNAGVSIEGDSDAASDSASGSATARPLAPANTRTVAPADEAAHALSSSSRETRARAPGATRMLWVGIAIVAALAIYWLTRPA